MESRRVEVERGRPIPVQCSVHYSNLEVVWVGANRALWGSINNHSQFPCMAIPRELIPADSAGEVTSYLVVVAAEYEERVSVDLRDKAASGCWGVPVRTLADKKRATSLRQKRGLNGNK